MKNYRQEAHDGQASKLRQYTAKGSDPKSMGGGKDTPRSLAASRSGGTMAIAGVKPKANLGRYARGGAVKGKGTNVNIVIASPQKESGPPAVPPMAMPPAPAPAPVPPSPGAGAPPMMGAPVPTVPMRHGGRAYKRGGRVHDDAAQDKAMLKKMVKPSALKADGGAVEMMPIKPIKFDEDEPVERKRGGAVYTAGAGTAEGRLEKIAAYGKQARRK